MKIYIILKNDNFFDDFYIYNTKEVAEKYYNHLGSEKVGYFIKELELLKE